MFHFRLNKRDIEYAALEDEFRMGLQIEANRFREVSGPFFLYDDCYYYYYYYYYYFTLHFKRRIHTISINLVPWVSLLPFLPLKRKSNKRESQAMLCISRRRKLVSFYHFEQY